MKIAGLDVSMSMKLHGTCPKCRNSDLKEEDNGWFEKFYYCPNCKTFFKLQLRKMEDKKINKEYAKKIIEKYKPKETNE